MSEAQHRGDDAANWRADVRAEKSEKVSKEASKEANKEAEAFEKEANAAPQGDPTSPDHVLPLADNGFTPESVSADYDQSESFFFPPPPSAPPVLEVTARPSPEP